MEEKKENDLLAEMSVPKAFLRLALPAVAAQLINILYNLVDKMFIGHIPGVGKQALAGVGVTAPVILAVSAFAALVSMGGAPKASIFMGKGNNEQAEKVMGCCTWMLIILSVALTGIMLIFGKTILQLFGASDDTITYATDYMNIYCLGTLFTQLTLGLNAFITAQGKTLISMCNVAAGAVTNIILDAIFINGLGIGVKGAALATVISQGVSTCFVVHYLMKPESKLKLRLKNIRFDKKLLLPCVLLGTSPALMQLTENMVAISFNTSLQKYGGDMAVASMSILNSIMQFVMLLLPGLVQGAQPLLSYNLGAKNIHRVKKTFRLLLVCCVGGSFLIWLVCMTAPAVVAGVFTDDVDLIAYTEKSLRVYLAMLFIYGVQVACQYSFVALDQAKKAIFLTIWRKIILLIPLIFILPRILSGSVMGVYLAEPIADTIAVCTTAPMFFCYYRKLK
ncbi:MATE family efflux transporter [Blautia sp. MSJ-19]|uniref:MATE family efflux transporter n=1 Tax=Blautia sp. MSJ-19 TaxID=2841517 RepID=UPI001C0EC761|nr:MATE family efflux transporter [Blautia sp. MSJ-19]MBU5481993.1 MATE family efflux transporter [Blautia sp. MSJ-19]